MENTIYPKDYVLVNKLSYGTKVPNNVKYFPVIGNLFKKSNVSLRIDLYKQLPKLKNFKREDIIVFKSVERDKKFLVKRIIGLPGDTLKIVDSRVQINNKYLIEKDNYTYRYLSKREKEFSVFKTFSNLEWNNLPLQIKKKYTKNILKNEIFDRQITLFNGNKLWTRDNFGPVIIPKTGLRFRIDKDNINTYRFIIENFEQEKIDLVGVNSKIYRFKYNYYFMMGDSRHNSIDSRSYGFIPESYLLGKIIKTFSGKSSQE